MEISTQIAAMRLGAAYKGVIAVRGFRIEVRPLTIGETIHVTSEVLSELEKLPTNMRNQLTEHTLIAQKTLIRASTPSPAENQPRITDMVVQQMTPDELHALYKEYCAVVERANPSMESIAEDELARLLDEVKKNPNSPALTDLSFSQLLSMVRYLLINRE